MLEAKDQGHKRKCSSKKKKAISKKKKGLHKNFSGNLQKKRSLQKFFKRFPQNNVFQRIFQALHKILTIQKILLSSSRGQANFRGLEASSPRPRTSKCVLEAKDVLEDSISVNFWFNLSSFFSKHPVYAQPKPRLLIFHSKVFLTHKKIPSFKNF